MTSFPFLAIARDTGRPYGEIIRLVDWMERILAIDPGYFTMPARGDHPSGVFIRECLAAITAERSRRETA
jgi:hypothetical protein